MLSLEKDDTNIETDLISRLQIELNSSNTIFNFIIYDERVDPEFGNYEQQLLLNRYPFLDKIWEQNNIESALVKVLLINYSQVKSQIPMIKDLKISNNWNQKDTQSPINNDDRCIKSSNVKKVEYNDYGIPLGATLAELGGNQLEKLRLIAINNEKQNDKKNKRVVIDIEQNKMKSDITSKRKRCDSDKTDDLLFVYPFDYNIDEEYKITQTFNELDGKSCLLQDGISIWTSPVNSNGMELSRKKVSMTNGNGYITINKMDKERIVTIPGVEYSMNHWFNDVLVDFWMAW